MPRVVSAEIDLETAASVDLIFQIATRADVPLESESLTFSQDIEPVELVAADGTRFHRIRSLEGPLEVRYRAVVETQDAPTRTPELELIPYLRPSRYSESDILFPQARREFRGLSGAELVIAVTDYVADTLAYTRGASSGTDSAVTILPKGQGVCRDYAHSVVALLRAMDVPARYAACYAPGLVPMDFHAVAEAWVDGAWHVVDATRLANRHGLVRIATGVDAAACAWLSYHGGAVSLKRLRVDAQTDAPLDHDDHSALIQIA
ncbi:transglutaminase-like domain-containing protein [Microbacterium sp. ASV49]|uniref:Transglutaminase family protein n=1 Tax=Microbacterium candidum TaxID=3041922 RepID=A0ABT7N182_9MICO|nr:transglutaminase family protein [Microbacterium sp. ASV49]MDL9980464.1 transglutaminase family protein [Microbacterium sp. ASV49]